MIPYVLDASVVAKLAIVEPGTAEFRAWFADHAGEEFHAPALLYSEVGRVIQRNEARATPKDLASLHERALRSVHLQSPVASEGISVWAVTSGLSFYDAEYVRLAQRLGGVLVTADKRMAEQARKHGVQVKEF